VVVRDRPDRSRVVVERRGAGYVQHPYEYRGHDYVARTYYVNGRSYQRYYRSYDYRGVSLDVYAPRRYYSTGFYAYVGTPWVRPVHYSWGFATAPWYGAYGFYFQPYPVYYSADLWLTDYLISQALAASYQAQIDAQIAYNAPPSYGQPALTPEMKQAVADEVRRQIALENSEAQANAGYNDLAPSASSIDALLSDGQRHVFVAGEPLDLVDAAGNECAVTEGDVLQLAGPPPPGASSAALIVTASKGGLECRQGSSVYVAFQDLQDMQNYMRQTIDQGLADLQSHQNGLPMPPPQTLAQAVPASYSTAAPPPDQEAANQINQQYQDATQAEQQTLADARSPAPDAAISPGVPSVGGPAGAPPTITLGQTLDQVVAAFGQPTQVVDLGSKRIYVYPNLKVTFTDGAVSDVQ
jgi:hypothetical protein